MKTCPCSAGRFIPVTVFPNTADDKCASCWLLATPSQDLSIPTAAFREALSSHLCLPSPAIRTGGWAGKMVGKGKREEVIDRFGDAVMCCRDLCGDSWRHRHDDFQQFLMAEAALSSFNLESELYYRFSDLLPATLEEEGGELQYGRQRQGVVPDFGFFEDTPEGPVPRLAELKFISAGRSAYPRGDSLKGTERRAAKLTNEYERSLWLFDVRFHGTQPRDLRTREPEPPPGPLVQRFRSYGGLCQGKLVAGA